MLNPNGTMLRSKFVAPCCSDSQRQFLQRNHVHDSYHGPVFAVEDVWVPCSKCTAPVDPVVRVPVGSMWFHPHCLRCAVCNVACGTRVFHAIHGHAVCSGCHRRGFAKGLKMPRAPSRAGNAKCGSQLEQRQQRMLLQIGPSCADPRCMTPRQQRLLERQMSIQQHDSNILMLPEIPTGSRSSGGNGTGTPSRDQERRDHSRATPLRLSYSAAAGGTSRKHTQLRSIMAGSSQVKPLTTQRQS